MYTFTFIDDDNYKVVAEQIEFGEPLATGMIISLNNKVYTIAGSAYHENRKAFFVIPFYEIDPSVIQARNSIGRKITNCASKNENCKINIDSNNIILPLN